MRELLNALRGALGLPEQKEPLHKRAPGWLHKKITGRHPPKKEAAEVPGRGMGPGRGDPATCPRRKAGLGPRRLRKRLGGGGPPAGNQ
jgi:hypothetical protein